MAASIIPTPVQPVAAGYLMASSAYNLASPNGIQKTIRLANDPNATKFDVAKSAAGDILDASMIAGPAFKFFKNLPEFLPKTYLKLALHKSAKNWDGKTVPFEYFKAPDKVYRVTETPEVKGLKEQGKNITTSDADKYFSNANNFRLDVIRKKLYSKDGYWYVPRKKGKINLTKEGAAHGNKTQASAIIPWKGTFARSGKFPQVMLEINKTNKIDYAPTNRKHFINGTWEEAINSNPLGAIRIGYSTGEMPMENLRWFVKNGNKYIYKGPIIPDKIIYIE